ncbi:hypothetical protein KUG88_28895 [Rhodococcus rhodochrous]|uniref:hypothetical protein n=1 Tax=Rhodococcus rhodochrous TaxID=1829 RepID=UPI001E50591E|nr:hypothetical protein [Rhodococcus rhodochrous]MCB8914113.1 hypothetical protein [Rhodococcus rhodochrous]
MQSEDYFVDGEDIFDTERRGYSREQVDRHLRKVQLRESAHSSEIGRLEHEVHLITRQRDWERHVAEERRKEIDVLHEGMAQLAARVKELEESPTANAALGLRIQRMLTLAEDEARSKIHEAEKVAEDLMARAVDESRELVKIAEARSVEAQSELEAARVERVRMMEEVRREASKVMEEAEAFKRKVESEASAARDEISASLEVEIEERARRAAALIQEREKEASRVAETIIAQARMEAEEKIKDAEAVVEIHRRECANLKLSEDSLMRKMAAVKDALEAVLHSCGRDQNFPELTAGVGTECWDSGIVEPGVIRSVAPGPALPDIEVLDFNIDAPNGTLSG